MMGWLRTLIFPRPVPFLCGWAWERSAFHEPANNDMPEDMGDLLELHGTRLEYRQVRAPLNERMGYETNSRFPQGTAVGGHIGGQFKNQIEETTIISHL